MSTFPTPSFDNLQGARERRRAKLSGERPNAHQPEKVQAFDQSVSQDQANIESKQKDILDWAKQAKPDEIAAFRNQLDARAKDRTQAKPDDKHEQVVFQTTEDWRQRREPCQNGQQEGQKGEGQVMLTASQRQEMGPGKLGYAHFAAGAKKEAAFMKSYEANFDWAKQEAQSQKNIYRQ